MLPHSQYMIILLTSVFFFRTVSVIPMNLSWNVLLHLPNSWSVWNHVGISCLKELHWSLWNMQTSYLVSCKISPVTQKLLWTWRLEVLSNNNSSLVALWRTELDQYLCWCWVHKIWVLLLLHQFIWLETNKQTNSVALVYMQTIPTKRPLLVSEVRANFC
jgi:hypothetical protein